MGFGCAGNLALSKIPRLNSYGRSHWQRKMSSTAAKRLSECRSAAHPRFLFLRSFLSLSLSFLSWLTTNFQQKITRATNPRAMRA